ncbi:E3 ubiquitin-protein ligase SINAT3 [Ananas comosus]|uniref:RING-type E3 ubiquitin transferase n=1 Tax=Ananas comosus TaxID=4615 RepID=A0A199V1X7_ANACO|nr:E3 ubiquitin-protein ligase SINAT3 [Ananas comosus]
MGDQSSSASGGNGGDEDPSLRELLECPICLITMHPPIYQCKNGHPLCSACKSKVGNQCPTCRQELGDIRCLVLEKVAEKFKHSCKYQSSGCPEVLPYSIKSKHEEQCSFRPFNCPYPRCSVVGNISFLVAHLKDSHNGRTSNGCSYSERYIITYETGFQDRTWKPVVFHCYGHYFCLFFESFHLSGSPIYLAYVRFMGEDNEARKYSYGLAVKTNGRKMTWEGIPRSIRDSHESIRDSLDGFMIHSDMATFFFEEDIMRVACWILQEQQTAGNTSAEETRDQKLENLCHGIVELSHKGSDLKILFKISPMKSRKPRVDNPAHFLPSA